MTVEGAATMRQRVIAAALELTAAQGWSAVTMSAVADHVGVSRQTVYNEVGSKPALAEAMVLAELERFLEVVGLAFDAHPRDLGAAVAGAVEGVLALAADNELLREIVSSSNGASSELLPPLSTDAHGAHRVRASGARRAAVGVRRPCEPAPHRGRRRPARAHGAQPRDVARPGPCAHRRRPRLGHHPRVVRLNAPSGETTPVGRHGDGVRDDQDAEAPGERDPQVGAHRLLRVEVADRVDDRRDRLVLGERRAPGRAWSR